MKKEKYIIKRDGSKEPFNLAKIANAINRAYMSLDIALPDKDLLNDIIYEIDWWEDITVEDIQDQIEEVLIRFDLPLVAKAFILYREKHKERREKVKEKWNFIHNFVQSDNAANTTIDDNSNVGTKGIAVLNAEIHKPDNKDTNLYIWEQWLKKEYPDFPVKQMQKDFETICYAHDFSSQIMMPYCMAVSMYPFLLNGLKDLGGKSAVPKNIDSFCGIYINLVFALASEVKGAVATPEFLMYMDYFCRKEWGDNYYAKSDVSISNEHCLRHKTIGNQIDQYFQQVTYSINQIAGSRGAQSPL